jgi:hypothetical protein
VCTVLLRFAPEARWPLLLAAVRDEFLERSWDPPAHHWPASAPDLVGGLDRAAHGTWLAVRPATAAAPGAVAALLNGVRLPPPAHGARPTRGGLPLTILTGRPELDPADLAGYDGFHLLLADTDAVMVWTWDGERLDRHDLAPGHHILVNAGVDRADSPLVAHHGPRLRALAEPDPEPESGATATAWGSWVGLLRGDELPGDDPRALIVRHTFTTEAGDELTYGSSSASLVAIGRPGTAVGDGRRGSVRFDFTAAPADPQWSEVSPL